MLPDTDVELRNALGFETGIWDIESIAWTFPKRAKIKNVWRTEAVTNIRNKLRPVCCIEYLKLTPCTRPLTHPITAICS